MIIILYYPKIKNDNILEVNDQNIIDDMYYQLASIPTIEQFKSYKNIDKIVKSLNVPVPVPVPVSVPDFEQIISLYKEHISKLDYKLPLFDYSTKNIYLVSKDDVYIKVTDFNYRFPDSKIIDLLNETIKSLSEIKKDFDWINPYIEKLNKNLNFLSNYDLTILKETYTDVFLNTNPLSRELTSCIKPSYLPYQKYQSPYYTKSELISMALNLKIIKDLKLKPWSYTDSKLKKICKKLLNYEINTKMLIYNQLYILYNNAKSYVQYYSLFGSYYMNSYLRNSKSVYDTDLNYHIDNLLKLIQLSPPFDNEYEVYRFIENDDYLSSLKLNDIFNENSFISTTRNPFYSMTNNIFGFILIKIRIPKDIEGIALLMESYSNYPYEQEILLPPSQLKLISIDHDFKYYHWNKLAEKKIIKKYVFEYLKPISYDIQTYVNKYKKLSGDHPLIDFYSITFEGSTVNERMINFFDKLSKINLRRGFITKIGDKNYLFYAYFLTQNKIYSKFFFLQKESEKNKMLGDEIYLTFQDQKTGEIHLLVEIRNIISVNYYHRFSGLKNSINEDDLLHWLAGLGKSLDIQDIIIHGNYSSYAYVVENILIKADISKKSLLDDFKIIQNIDNPDANILNLYTADIDTYCIDLIEYIFENKKRFSNKEYIEKKVPYHMIDKLKTDKFIDLYNNHESKIYEALQLYNVYRKLDNPNISAIEFYKLIHLSYPYLVSKLQDLIIFSYPRNSVLPWHFYYVFKPFEYLFERSIINYLPTITSNRIEELIKNLEDEVKFIRENKFRQIKQDK